MSAIKPPASALRRLIYIVPIVLLAAVAAILFFSTKPARPIAVPTVPVPPQVIDLRPPQESLLNPPILPSSPVASWNTQNIHGTLVIKGDHHSRTIVYPNGTEFSMDTELFSFSGAASTAFSKQFGTVVVKSNGIEDDDATWQAQIQVDQAKDINGDGFPEIVLSDYSGGAHCCTTIAVISLRPQGPVVVFDEDLGSDDADFKDIEKNGRREIQYEYLFEYALGSFAQGTFGVPVICKADKDGVYQVDTRAFPRIMSHEYDASERKHRKAAYGSEAGAMEEDRDLIDLFFRAYLAGHSEKGFEALSHLRPPVNGKLTASDPRMILEAALKEVAPEVLQESEWARIKSGQPLAAEYPTPAGRQ